MYPEKKLKDSIANSSPRTDTMMAFRLSGRFTKLEIPQLNPPKMNAKYTYGANLKLASTRSSDISGESSIE
jgi:hypothetical protein